LSAASLSHITKLVAQHGSDIWWSASIEELLPPEVCVWERGGGAGEGECPGGGGAGGELQQSESAVGMCNWARRSLST